MNITENKYNFLKAADLTPTGWLYNQLKTEADGLAGNLDKIWPDVRDSRWIGGSCEGWERVPYWLDGFVPLAYLLRDDDRIARAKKYIDAILAGQCEDGWICPCSEEERAGYDMWALLLLTKVLVVYADCEPSYADRIETAVSRAIRQAIGHLSEHPLFNWGKYRWFEGLIAAYWLYERTHEDWILDYCDLLHDQGKDYKKLIDEEFEQYQIPERKWQWDTHVVNLSMAIKAETLWQKRLGGEISDCDSRHMYETLMQYHGMANGHFTGDECLAGKAPIQGTELCGVCEAMYSDEWLLAITGNVYWGDILERLAFNALPATISADMWTHQYDQQINQIGCAPDIAACVFGTNGQEANLFGLEPNYGCCTANMPQGWPKFALSSIMKNENALFVASPVPMTVNTTLHGTPVKLEISGGYPFRDTVKIAVTVDAPVDFALDIRIPGFAKTAVLDGEALTPGTIASVSRTWQGTTEMTLTFGYDIKLESALYEDLLCVNRGALLYSVPISYEKIMREYTRGGVERKFPYCDYMLISTSDWGYAFTDTDFIYTECAPIPADSAAFDQTKPCVKITANLAKIDWGREDGFAFVCARMPKCREVLETVKVDLIPYGCTDLRMTAMPRVMPKL